MAMKILAFDTSTEWLSVAVGVQQPDGAWTVRAHHGPGGAQASAALIPEALRLLREAGLSVDALDAIAFGAGPGSFTGLRTACAVAQGLALGARAGRGLPVLPVCTLTAVAESARMQQGCTRVLAVLDARMDEVYAARLAWTGSHWQAQGAPQLLRPHDVPALEDGVLAGNAFDTYAAHWSAPVRAMPRVPAWPTAQAMLALAPAGIAAGQAVPAEQAMPVYIRDKVAQTTEERAAAKAAASAPP